MAERSEATPASQRLNIHLFRATAQKKQQLLSSSQASCMATHSPRASSAPSPRCQRPPAPLQLSRSAPSPIAFAFCARRFPGRAAPTVSRRARRRARPTRAALRLPEVWVEPAPAHGTPSRAVVLASEDLLPYRAEYTMNRFPRLLLCLIVQPKRDMPSYSSGPKVCKWTRELAPGPTELPAGA